MTTTIYYSEIDDRYYMIAADAISAAQRYPRSKAHKHIERLAISVSFELAQQISKSAPSMIEQIYHGTPYKLTELVRQSAELRETIERYRSEILADIIYDHCCS